MNNSLIETTFNRRRWRQGPLGLAAASALLVVLATPGFDASWLIWIALVPLLVAVKSQTGWPVFGLTFAAGFLANAGIVQWVALPSEVKAVDFLLIATYLGLFWGLFGVLTALLRLRGGLPIIATAPVVWVCLEYVRSHFFFLELPWVLLGHTQYLNTTLIQVASVTGVYGVSYVIVLVNSLLAETITERRCDRQFGIGVGLILSTVLVYGQIQIQTSSDDARFVSVAIIPGNIAQSERWDPLMLEAHLARYVGATRQALANSDAALVVWPESAVPGQLRRDMSTVRVLEGLVRDGHTSLLLGSADREKFKEGEGDGARFNSAFLLSPSEQKLKTYHKIKLLPFGEYLPMEDVLPWPSRYRSQASHYLPGTDYKVFSLRDANGEEVRFSVVICWESIFPDFVRRFVQRGATFLVAISNEAWFSGTSATSQLLAMNVFRAVENRRAVIRSVNGGLSGFIDPYGRLLAVTAPEGSGNTANNHLVHEIPILSSTTFYSVYGDVFAHVVMAGGLLLLLIPAARAQNLALAGSFWGTAGNRGQSR